MDNVSISKRSQVMAAIKSKDTKPELAAKQWLWKQGYRYARSSKGLPGSPDIVFPSLRSVVFVHGCFWHGHNCKRGALPSSNVQFWSEKIARNKKRDKRNVESLKKLGWAVNIVWQCRLEKDLIKTEKFLARRRGTS